MDVVVDTEFAALIPPLGDEEYRQLEHNILQDGCRDPFVVWAKHNILLDGHTRKRICDQHGKPYPTIKSLKLADRNAAADWIDANQLGRRNLRPDAMSLLRGRRYNRAKKQGSRTDLTSPQNEEKLTTAAGLARQHGVSRATIERDGQFATAVEKASKADPQIERKVLTGEVKKADIIREAKREAITTKLESVATKKAKAASGVYDVLVIDPPWPMQKIERDCRPNQTELDYTTMSEDELAAIKLPKAKDCHVWLWTTHKFLPMAFRLLEAWKLRYVCAFVWHKPGGFQPVGLPQYNCEFALYARRGTPSFIDTKQFNVSFSSPRGKHSEKPEAFYACVRRVTAGRRLDMFNRRKIEGFEGWGKETPE